MREELMRERIKMRKSCEENQGKKDRNYERKKE